MSWQEKIVTPFTIVTGDGKNFQVLWKNASKAQDFNISEFNFPDKEGTLVYRGTPLGRKFPLEIFFQGENHIEEAEKFATSSKDKRAWNVEHPLYGDILCHPSDLNFNNTGYNVTQVTGTLLETIPDENPRSTVNPVDKVTNDHELCVDTFNRSFANDVKPTVGDTKIMLVNNAAIYNEGKKSIKDQLDAEKYFNAFNVANSAIVKATGFPLDAIQKMQAVISAPALFVDSVRNRLATLRNQFNRLQLTVTGIASRAHKKIYEHNTGTMISSMALASVTEMDFTTRKDVVTAIDTIISIHYQYLTNLDSLKTDTADTPESYSPDFASLTALGDLINFTVANLFSVVVDSKQERSTYLEEDSNVILLAHRFYGLSADDSTIQKFIDQNNIGLNEILGIKKGRKILYYV